MRKRISVGNKRISASQVDDVLHHVDRVNARARKVIVSTDAALFIARAKKAARTRVAVRRAFGRN